MTGGGSPGAAEGPKSGVYILHLYVTGYTPKSVRAIDNTRRLCEAYLKDRYRLKVVDIYQQPELAAQEQLVAAPTLVKSLPLPARRMVGDMSDQARVLAGLGLRTGR